MVQRLFVLWQNEETRQKYHVGTLTKEKGVYRFDYTTDVKQRGLEAAQQAGFDQIFEFDLDQAPYESDQLFHFFAKRLPNKGRPSYKKLLSYLGLASDASSWDILLRTKGRLGGDAYECIEPIEERLGSFHIPCFVEGVRYYDYREGKIPLEVGDSLTLVCEEDNPRDPHAVQVKTQSDHLIGYVPAVYSLYVSDAVKEGRLTNATIRHLNPNGPPQLAVAMQIEGVARMERSSGAEAFVFAS